MPESSKPKQGIFRSTPRFNALEAEKRRALSDSVDSKIVEERMRVIEEKHIIVGSIVTFPVRSARKEDIKKGNVIDIRPTGRLLCKVGINLREVDPRIVQEVSERHATE
jgi:hypothetical protein